MLVKSIVGKTLGIKHHVVKQVEESEEGITVQLDLRRGRLLPCRTCGHLAVFLFAQLPTVLPRDADGVFAFFGHAGIVDDPSDDRLIFFISGKAQART